MTEEPEEQPPAPTPVVPPDLRLRGERPRVTRLSRKVLIGLGAVSALAVAGALGYALQTRNKIADRPGAAQHAEPPLRRGPRRAAERLYRPAAAGAPARAAAARRSRQADPECRRGAEYRRSGDHARSRRRSAWPRRPRRRASAASSPRPTSSRSRSASSRRRRRRRRAVRRPRRRSTPAPRRTCRIARRRSSTPRRTSERSAPTVSKPRLRPMSCRRER